MNDERSDSAWPRPDTYRLAPQHERRPQPRLGASGWNERPLPGKTRSVSAVDGHSLSALLGGLNVDLRLRWPRATNGQVALRGG
jgi:hypothetical protein